jgi:hypothetical protein
VPEIADLEANRAVGEVIEGIPLVLFSVVHGFNLEQAGEEAVDHVMLWERREMSGQEL